MSFNSSSFAAAIAAAIAVPLVLTACTPPRKPATSPAPAQVLPAAPPVGGTCSPAPAQFAVGKVADASLVEDARQRSGSRLARVLRPGQVVTMEFSAERLNLAVDATGKVTRVTCG